VVITRFGFGVVALQISPPTYERTQQKLYLMSRSFG
jgi:hypothetical protein